MGTPSASLALDSNDVPHISCAASSVADCSARYAYWWPSDSWWSTSREVAGYGSLDISSDGAVHVSYYDEESQTIEHTCLPLATNDWETHGVSVDVEPVSQSHTSLKLDAAGRPRVSYYKGNYLYQARWLFGDTWENRPIAADVATETFVEGQHTSLVIREGDGLGSGSHVAYYDSNLGALSYAHW